MSAVRLGPVTITNSPRSAGSAARDATAGHAAGKCSANWPVRRSRLIKTDSAAAGQFDGDWDDAAS